MVDRENVKVEASDTHHWIVGVFLVSDGKVCKRIPYKSEVVVCGANRLEEGRAGGEERNILDVWVVFLLGC